MPSGFLRKLSKETGKSIKELEDLWKKAKEIASEEFGKDEEDFGSKEYAYATGTVKAMVGIKEELVNPVNFLKSEKSAKEYIQETMTSSSLSGLGEPGGFSFEPEEDDDDDYDEDDSPIIDPFEEYFDPKTDIDESLLPPKGL